MANNGECGCSDRRPRTSEYTEFYMYFSYKSIFIYMYLVEASISFIVYLYLEV